MFFEQNRTPKPKQSKFLFRGCKFLIFRCSSKNNKMVNKNIEVVKLEMLKVKTWFCDKDLSKNNKMVDKNVEVVKLHI